MIDAEERFHAIAASLPGMSEGKMFGALCIKAPNGKAGVMLHKGEMVFKLSGERLTEALALDGARNFDPSGGRPMKEWVQLPVEHADRWQRYAEEAMARAAKL
jgi:hypothetical protein